MKGFELANRSHYDVNVQKELKKYYDLNSTKVKVYKRSCQRCGSFFFTVNFKQHKFCSQECVHNKDIIFKSKNYIMSEYDNPVFDKGNDLLQEIRRIKRVFLKKTLKKL